MVNEMFACQICAYHFASVINFKKHLLSDAHQVQFTQVFPNEIYRRNINSYTPWIFVKEPDLCPYPLLGLSQLSLCFSSDRRESFYLCHVCEAKFNVNTVELHVSHKEHFLHYFGYNDPNMLSFPSEPTGNSIPDSLMKKIVKEKASVGSGRLQVLHLPDMLYWECSEGNYRQAMFLLHQNESLCYILNDLRHPRVEIPRYRDDVNRKHPLIGLKYIVECSMGFYPISQLRLYLCTLCRLQLSFSKIIRHLLTFEHVYTYLSLWHPNTLKARECYDINDPSHASALLDFAKQAEELQGRTMIKRIHLEASQMLFVLNASFEDALRDLERLHCSKYGLVPKVRPRKKLEPTLPETTDMPPDGKEDMPVAVISPETSEKSHLKRNIHEESEAGTAERSAAPSEPTNTFRCQNCSKHYETYDLYFKHLSICEHLENFEKHFGAVCAAGDCQPSCSTFTFTEADFLSVGVSLVVTVLCRELSEDPVHLCVVCEAVFQSKERNFHMNSDKHIILCLMYLNPWKLPFAWKTALDIESLKALASKEEDNKGRNIRILDVPLGLFPKDMPLSYSKVMEKLGSYHNLLMHGVPPCETFTKLDDNETFPILGRNFLVKYGHMTSGWKFLCLLCEHPLSSVDYTGHVFSWKHVATFLEKFHPGSLDLNDTDENILLDLAKQAAALHPVSKAQEIEFDGVSFYMFDKKLSNTKISLLSALSDAKQKDGKGDLMPRIETKSKLFIRQQREKTPKESNVKAELTSVPIITEKVVDEAQSITQESAQTTLQKNTSFSTEQTLKEDKQPESNQLEKISVESSIGDCKSTDTMKAASKRKRNPSDMDTSDSDTEELNTKDECLSNLDEEKKSAKIPNMDKTKAPDSRATADVKLALCYSSNLLAFIQQKNRPAVIGLSEIYECVCKDRALIYLCECCKLKFKEEHITKHLCESWHYTTYLGKAGTHSLPTGKFWEKNMSILAAKRERIEGSGQANVVKMTPEDYNRVKSTEFKHALLLVKTCLAKTFLSNKGLKPKLVTLVSKTEPIPGNDSEMPETMNLKQSSVQKKAPVMVSQCLPSAATPLDLPSSNLLNTDKSFKQALDRLDGTSEEISLDMTKGALTGKKPVCIFITSRPVIPMTDSEIINSRDIVNDQFQYTTSASSRIADTPKITTKPVCKFLSPKSATKNMSSPAMTNVEATQSVQKCTISVSNAGKAAPNQQDGSVQSKFKAESDTAGDPAFKVGMLCDYSFGKIDELFSSQTKLSTLEHTNIQGKTTKRQQLNIKAASHVKHKDSESGNEMLTPSSPSCDPIPKMPVIEMSQKAPAKMPYLGVDQLLQVICEDHHHCYCLACLTRLEATSHMNTAAHQINCVKLKFPWWSSKPGEEELSKMVAHLLDDEMALKKKPKRVEVSADVYKELKSLPDNKAIQKASDLLRRDTLKSFQQQPLALTSVVSNPTCEITRSPSASPCDAVNSELEKEKNTPIQSNAQHVKPFPGSVNVAPQPSSPVNKPISVVAPRIIKGTTTDEISNLSHIMAVKDIVAIGLCFVWECRVVPPKHPTFYLCESCSETIPVSEICNHMTSRLHHYHYLTRQYPHFMYWEEEELPQHIQLDLIDLIAHLVKEREESMDAQTVLLSEEWYESVRTAPFFDALNVVQRIKKEKKVTSLPFITMSPEEDQTNHMASSTTDTEHKCDADCTSDTDSVHSTLSDFLNPESPCVTSFNAPKQPNEPAHPAKTLNLAMSSKNEDDEVFVPEIATSSSGNSPPSHGLTVTPPTIDTIEAESSASLEVMSTDINLKPDNKLCLPLKQQIPFSLNPIENNVAKCAEDKQMPEEYLSKGHEDAPSPVGHNSNKNPPLDPVTEDKDASDKCYYQLLISLVKQKKKEKQLETPAINQALEPCTTKLSKNEEVCIASKCTKNVGHTKIPIAIPKHETDGAAEVDIILIEDDSKPSDNKKAEKPDCDINLTSVFRDNPNQKKIPELTPSLKQHYQSKDVKSTDECKVLPKLQVQINGINTQEIKDRNKVPCSEVSVLTSQLGNKISQTSSQYSNAPHLETQKFQSLSSQQKLRLTLDTQVSSPVPPKPSSSSCPLVRKYLMLNTKNIPVFLKVPDQLNQTQNQELQLQPQIQMAQSQNANQQDQSPKEQKQSYLDDVQLMNNLPQVQSPVSQFQPQVQTAAQTQVAPQTLSLPEQIVRIDSRITPRKNTRYFRRDADNRQSSSATNSSFPVSQIPITAAILPPVPSGNVFTEYGHNLQTTYSSNATYSNTGSMYATAQPSHVYHHLQTQQFYTSVPHSSQHPEFSGWMYPNTQLQPADQTFSPWSNESQGQTTTANPNAVSVNAVCNQGYLYNYNNTQEYNTVLMRSLYYSSSVPTQNPQFFSR